MAGTDAKAVGRLGRLTTSNCYFFLCDMQEKFRPSIRYFPEIITIAQRMVGIANVLKIPVIVTEHAPKGLGSTVSEIDVSSAKVFSKIQFSMAIPEVMDVMSAEPQRNAVVLFGVKTQVCVQQTALDLLDKGYDVHILADGCSSHSQMRLRGAGVFLTTSDSVAYELLGNSGRPEFKEVKAIIKSFAPTLDFLQNQSSSGVH